MLASVVGFTVGVTLVGPAVFAQGRAVDPAVYEKLDVFAHVLEKIRSSYVESVTETKVIENAINGMLTSLDPHSSYMDTEDFNELRQSTQGEFGGLGILREEEKRTFPVTITRAKIQVKPVKSKLLEGNIGHLRISTFNDFTEGTLVSHLKALEEQNKAPLQGLILDVRNNPGGLLMQAVAVADDFLDDGEIVSTRGRIAGPDARYTAKRGDLMQGKPMVVLVNGGSASAAEIVAGALQDHKRAVVMGTKSFGKGSVQTIFELPGNAGMRLTTALYYTPAGTSIQAHGIVPDIVVKPLKTKEQEALALDDEDLPTEAGLLGHLNAGADTAVSATRPVRADLPSSIYVAVPQKSPSDTLAGLDGKPDAQLDRAVSVIKTLIAAEARKAK
jgi:carboxyl-terminal processing protease